MRSAAESAAEAERCTVEFEHLWRIDPIPFDDELIAALEAFPADHAPQKYLLDLVRVSTRARSGERDDQLAGVHDRRA